VQVPAIVGQVKAYVQQSTTLDDTNDSGQMNEEQGPVSLIASTDGGTHATVFGLYIYIYIYI